MKKVLIISHAMELGGAEQALLGFLESYDRQRYAVDLFLLRHQGELLPSIPGDVHLLPENKRYACLGAPIGRVLRGGHFGIAFGRLLAKLSARLYGARRKICPDEVELEYSHKYTLPFMPKISPEHYDIVISFLTPHYFAARRVDADYRIAWIHTDYGKINVDVKSEEKMWGYYDRIMSISEKSKEGFSSVFPRLSGRITVMENIMSGRYIDTLADRLLPSAEMPADGSFRILSVGRFSDAKRFDEVPLICRLMREKGIDVKWYLIGYGGDEGLIRRRIAEQGMGEHVIILGKKTNPYPYMKLADLYCQPSRYEGKSVAVREAQYLHRPVAITAYDSAESQLQNGFDGVIVPMPLAECADALARLVRNKRLLADLAANTCKVDYTGKDAMAVFDEIAEGCR